MEVVTSEDLRVDFDDLYRLMMMMMMMTWSFLCFEMDVSKNMGVYPPKSSILIGLEPL